MKPKTSFFLAALFAGFSIQVQAAPRLNTVPEPASLALLALGFLALALIPRLNPASSLSRRKSPTIRKNTPSRYSSAKLLRRDVRNSQLVFKFNQQRKRNLLQPSKKQPAPIL